MLTNQTLPIKSFIYTLLVVQYWMTLEGLNVLPFTFIDETNIASLHLLLKICIFVFVFMLYPE